MGQPKNEVGENTSNTSENCPSEKKTTKLLKTAGKIVKKSFKGKNSMPDKKNNKDLVIKAESIEKSKPVEEIIIKSGQIANSNDQKEKNTEKTEASDKEAFGGYIFMCNGRTKPDCFNYKVFGLPENRKECAFRIKPGMKLFLYDFDLKLLYGIFKASSFGGMNLEPSAFNGSYPAQVRFEVEKSCAPIPHSIFKHAIKDNFTGIRNMFKTELSIEQVNALSKIFPPSSQQHPILNMVVPAPHHTTTQISAPARIQAPAPVVLLQPTMHPLGRPIHSLPPLQREIVYAPITAMPQAYDAKLSYHNDPSQMRMNNAGFSLQPWANSITPLQPVPHVRFQHEMPTVSNYVLVPSVDPRLGNLHPSHAQNAQSVYSTGNEPQIGNSSHLGSMPVSSRYSFAGPSLSYKRGHIF